MRRRVFMCQAGAGLLAGAAAARQSLSRTLTGRFVPPSLQREVAYVIHLPPVGSTGDAELPVLYFLHGLRDDEEVWERRGLAEIADAMQARGEIPPMAVAVMDGGRSFYTNAHGDGPREEDAVFPEFVSFTEKRLLGARCPGRRAIAGISMGGYGALKIACKRPGHFAAAGALSGSFLPPGEFFSDGDGRLGKRLREIFGPPGNARMREENDIYRIVARLHPAAAPAIFLACGEQDRYGFQTGTRAVAGALQAAGVAVTLRLASGRHGFSYWRSELPELLRFVGARWRSPAAPCSGP